VVEVDSVEDSVAEEAVVAVVAEAEVEVVQERTETRNGFQ
jgi:hypothetical protein